MQILTSATGAIYRVPAARETCIEDVVPADGQGLVAAFRRAAVDQTNVTLRREAAFEYIAFAANRQLELAAAGIALGWPAVVDATPFTIGPLHGGVLERRLEPAAQGPPAYQAFKELVRWLDAEDAPVADMVGIGRTTPYAWNRDGREPRAATAQRIYEHHATLDSLRRRQGAAGLRRWLHEGHPTRREVLLGGGLEMLESDVHDVLFRRSPDQRPDLAAAPEEAPDPETEAVGEPIRPSGRRPRRPPP